MRNLLQSGKKLSPLTTYSQRLNRLRDRLYCNSEDYFRERLVGAWSEMDHDDPRFEFISRFTVQAVASGIPVLCTGVTKDEVSMVHAQYRDRLHYADWVVFAQIGAEIVTRHGLKAEWQGNVGRPWAWSIKSHWTAVDRLRLRNQLNNEIDAYCLSIYDDVPTAAPGQDLP